MIKRAALVLVFVVVVVAGGATPALASKDSKKHHVTAITKKQAAKQFEADDGPFSAARTAYGTAFLAWQSAHGIPAETASFVDAFVAACHTFEHHLDTQRWPSADKSDVRTFASSLTAVANDIASLPSITTVSGGDELAARFDSDSATSEADSNNLRHALGLPPLT